MNQGLFELTVMFFGVCNSPATFQTMINTIFTPLIAKNLILVYMNDILIHSPTKKQLYKTMKEVLKYFRSMTYISNPRNANFPSNDSLISDTSSPLIKSK